MKENKSYMQLAIELAQKGEGRVTPNPLVGAVVVKNDRIIGQGYHKKFGEAHAEINAINSVRENLQGAEIYVNLEPCCHYGKTPPCTKKIIESGITKCIIAMKDPNPLVAGKGIEELRNAGIKVVTGVMEKEAIDLNRVFINSIMGSRSYVFLKTAITLDGKIAAKTGDSKWISNEKARRIVQKLRNKYSGILIGSNTVINDNPRLTARIENSVDPYRIVLDPRLEIPISSNIIANNKDCKTIIFTSEKNQNSEKAKILTEERVRLIYEDSDEFNLNEILARTKEIGIDSVLVEGGSGVISEFFKKNCIDEGVIFIAPKLLGDECSIPLIKGFDIDKITDGIKLKDVKYQIIDDNIGVWFKGVE